MRFVLRNAATVIAAAAVLLAANTQAQEYPSRPVRLVIPFAAGGTTDSAGRLIASGLSSRLGQQFVVENRPGAGSQIGIDYVKGVAPDGYILGFGGSDGLVVLPAVKKKAPYDSVKDFSHIAIVANASLHFTVNAKVPANSLKEFIDYVKARPGKVRYGSAGVGTMLHLGIEHLAAVSGLDMIHVPYKGGAPMMTDVVAGEVELVLTSADFAKRWSDTGQLRVLAQADGRRHPLLPNVPTTADIGMPDLRAVSWFSLFGPAGLPRTVNDRISRELPSLLEDKTLIERLIQAGSYTRYVPGSEVPKIISEELAHWTKLVRDAKIPLQD